MDALHGGDQRAGAVVPAGGAAERVGGRRSDAAAGRAAKPQQCSHIPVAFHQTRCGGPRRRGCGVPVHVQLDPYPVSQTKPRPPSPTRHDPQRSRGGWQRLPHEEESIRLCTLWPRKGHRMQAQHVRVTSELGHRFCLTLDLLHAFRIAWEGARTSGGLLEQGRAVAGRRRHRSAGWWCVCVCAGAGGWRAGSSTRRRRQTRGRG